jgi:hypothetical protein
MTVGGSWHSLARDYKQLHEQLEGLKNEVEAMRARRLEKVTELRRLRQLRVESEKAKGEHFRAKIFEKDPTPEDFKERERLTKQVETTIAKVKESKDAIRQLLREQGNLSKEPEILSVHERRRAIELEAELKRMSLIREAVISSDGLEHANHRPSAWWFPLVCPGGKWFQSTVESAEYYLEHLTT